MQPVFFVLVLLFISVLSHSNSQAKVGLYQGEMSDSDTPVKRVLVIGAAGAIGKCLVEKMLSEGLEVVAGLRKTPLPVDLTSRTGLIQEFGVDCTDAASIRKCFENHSPIDTVWNLAAPLSVETAGNPDHAFNVVVNGMDRLLQAMREFNVPRICFSDSIGSYGGSSPRELAPASWLVANPEQDPGSDYGVQKRKCRELMRDFVAEQPETRSCRWAVIPGVLHSDPSWGAGTTEYALDALKCSAEGTVFKCPVGEKEYLPMIWRDDLIKGLYDLMIADKGSLKEPDGGYALAGLSFTPMQLFAEIEKRDPTFKYIVEKDEEKLFKESPAALFARLWVDSLSSEEANRDLGFKATVTSLGDIVDMIMSATKK